MKQILLPSPKVHSALTFNDDFDINSFKFVEKTSSENFDYD